MKRKLVSLAAAVLMTAGLTLTLPILPGCASSGTVEAGSESFVVEAEKDIRTAFNVVDAFLQWEAANRSLAGADVTRVADQLRSQFPGYLASARDTLRTYKTNRTPENRASLSTWLATINTAMLQAVQHMPAPAASAAYNVK
jgi:hypothetical protein